MMLERRTKRSADRREALQYLVENVADRSAVRALVLVDDAGQIVAGMGYANDVVDLARAARDVASRCATPAALCLAPRDADLTARRVSTPDGMLYLAALGDRVLGVGEAVRAVHRIVVETN